MMTMTMDGQVSSVVVLMFVMRRDCIFSHLSWEIKVLILRLMYAQRHVRIDICIHMYLLGWGAPQQCNVMEHHLIRCGGCASISL